MPAKIGHGHKTMTNDKACSEFNIPSIVAENLPIDAFD